MSKLYTVTLRHHEYCLYSEMTSPVETGYYHHAVA